MLWDFWKSYPELRLRGFSDIAIMTPEASHPLQEHVGGGEIGNHEVEVNIDALFHNLGGDKNAARAFGNTVFA
jgi:hypothetical protein